MSIKNIIFDIGGVLADFRIGEFLHEKGFDAEMSRRIIKAAVMSPYWEKFERGEITEEEALDGFASGDPEIREELFNAFSSVEGLLTARDYSIPLIVKLKSSGYNVFYLSNYSKKAYDECAGSLSFMPYMDGGLVSFRVGMTKPDPAMYEKLLKDYALLAGECLFIDDTPRNIDVARSLGWEGIVFQSYDQAVADMKAMGILKI